MSFLRRMGALGVTDVVVIHQPGSLNENRSGGALMSTRPPRSPLAFGFETPQSSRFAAVTFSLCPSDHWRRPAGGRALDL